MPIPRILPHRSAGRLLAACLFGLGLLHPVAVPAQDAADLVVRTNRLENQVRQLSGQIEQLQFENRRLQEQLKRFQEDVEFRFNERGGRPASTPAQGQPQRRSDAFDPGQNPGAPGTPQALGTTRGTPPGGVAILDDGGPGQPLDINGLARLSDGAASPAARGAPSIAATGGASAREIYDEAVAHYRARRYEPAEMGFRQMLQSFPRDRLAADAVHLLGETYAARQRHREAAEQFLRVTTEFATSPRAPEALLRLGVSLNALGAREQACATFAEAGRKHGQAVAGYRERVERERSRARCAA